MCSNCFLGHFSSRKCSCKTSAVYSASWCIHIHCFFSLPWRNSICLLYCASLFLMSGITWNLCKFSHRIWNHIHMFIHYHQNLFFYLVHVWLGMLVTSYYIYLLQSTLRPSQFNLCCFAELTYDCSFWIDVMVLSESQIVVEKNPSMSVDAKEQVMAVMLVRCFPRHCWTCRITNSNIAVLSACFEQR